MTEPNESQSYLGFDLCEKIAAAIEDALTTSVVSASGYGREFVRFDSDGMATLDGTFNINAIADAVIRELGLTEEFSEWPFDGKHRYVTEWSDE